MPPPDPHARETPGAGDPGLSQNRPRNRRDSAKDTRSGALRPITTLRVALPVDVEAERCAAACALCAYWGAHLAAKRIRPGDFYDPRLERIVWSAVRCPEQRYDDRLAWIAEDCGELRAFLVWLDDQPRIALLDVHGHYAKRIAHAAAARRRVLGLLDELDRLAVAA